MQKAVGLAARFATLQSRLLHRDSNQSGGFGRPCAAAGTTTENRAPCGGLQTCRRYSERRTFAPTLENGSFPIRPPERLQPLDDVAHRSAVAHQLDRHRHDVLLVVLRDRDELIQKLVDPLLIALATHAVQPCDLALGG